MILAAGRDGGELWRAALAHQSGRDRAVDFFCEVFGPNSLRMSQMRLLWAYLIVVIVFAFGFVCAATFTVGMPPPRRAPHGRKGHRSATRD